LSNFSLFSRSNFSLDNFVSFSFSFHVWTVCVAAFFVSVGIEESLFLLDDVRAAANERGIFFSENDGEEARGLEKVGLEKVGGELGGGILKDVGEFIGCGGVLGVLGVVGCGVDGVEVAMVGLGDMRLGVEGVGEVGIIGDA